MNNVITDTHSESHALAPSGGGVRRLVWPADWAACVRPLCVGVCVNDVRTVCRTVNPRAARNLVNIIALNASFIGPIRPHVAGPPPRQRATNRVDGRIIAVRP